MRLLPGDGSLGCRAHQLHVFLEHARRVFRRGCFPGRFAFGELVSRNLKLDGSRFHVDRNRITVAHQCDSPAHRRFGSHVADHESTRRAAEASVREQRHVIG